MQGTENKTRRQLRRTFKYTHILRKYYILWKINHRSEDLLLVSLLSSSVTRPTHILWFIPILPITILHSAVFIMCVAKNTLLLSQLDILKELISLFPFTLFFLHSSFYFIGNDVILSSFLSSGFQNDRTGICLCVMHAGMLTR